MKLMRIERFLGVMLAVVAGSAVSPRLARAADPAPMTSDVLSKLHESNQKEIEAGKMAEKKGGSKDVKEYGKMLVKDHGAADQKVMALAKKEKIALAKPEGKMEMPAEAKGAGFDSQFAKMMVDDHAKDIKEVTEARDTTKDEGLKELLTAMLPTLKKHEEMAQKIVDGMKK